MLVTCFQIQKKPNLKTSWHVGDMHFERAAWNWQAHGWRRISLWVITCKSIYEVCLFCFVVMRSIKAPGCLLQIAFLDVFGKPSQQGEGLHGLWFHDFCLDFAMQTKALEYWMISSLKIKLNRSSKFRRNWRVGAFGVVGKILTRKI